jgi:ABC-type uncharacterized transport system permease subunit
VKRGGTDDDIWARDESTPATGATQGTTALVVGLVSFFVPLLGLTAVILGATVLRDPRQGGRQSDRAFNAIIAGVVSTVLWVMVIAWVIAFGMTMIRPGDWDSLPF